MKARNTLANIRVVLIHTSHPGNIGSAARAMKTMGLSELYLVNPKSFPDEQAVAMSSNAIDILESAVVVNTMQEAIADCQLVVGASARHERALSWDIQDSRACGELLVQQASLHKVAVVFGRESSGLTNDELALCQHLLHIPTNPEYSSLNVASAVQIISYECRMTWLAYKLKQDDNTGLSEEESKKNKNLVTASDMEGYYQHLEEAMVSSGFLDLENPKHLMTRLRRIYGRICLERSELNILRGMLSAFQKKK